MILGTMMIFGALSLLLYNRHKEKIVGERSGAILSELENLITAIERPAGETGEGDDSLSEFLEPEDSIAGQPFPGSSGGSGQDSVSGEAASEDDGLPEGVIDSDMPCIYLDGYYYIGILELPALGMTLPVQWGWSDALMDVSPCRYNGTLEEGNLIIMAHNYSTHFGRIFDLAVGDEIYFTDILGERCAFEVCGVDVFGRSEIQKMYEGDWEMTLFTCVPNTYNRIAVRCRLAQ